MLAVIGWLHGQGVLATVAEARAPSFNAAGYADLRRDVAPEAALLDTLTPAPMSPAPPHASAQAQRPHLPTNLPGALTSFVGRRAALDEIQTHITRHRLVTLVGPGGVGKTRLAVECGRALHHADGAGFADGIWFVSLAPLGEASLLAETVAQVVQPGGRGHGPALDALCAYLADKQLLLILDNCEHLVDACAAFVETLLLRCRHLRIIATSREALRLLGENVYAVTPLDVSLASTASGSPGTTATAHGAAVRLFLERVEASTGSTPQAAPDWEVIGRICRRLDGIPLALELAASRAGELTLAEMAAQLDRQMRLLVSRYRGGVPRHRTMEIALAWSYRLLTPAAQHLLAGVSVFAGGWTLDGARAVCPAFAAETVDAALWELVEKSLVFVAGDAEARRFDMLEPIRQFAQVQLEALGAADDARRQHAYFFLAQAEALYAARDTAAEPGLLRAIQAEVDNLRAVNRWALQTANATFAWRFNGCLFAYHGYGSDLSEACFWLEAALELTPEAQDTASVDVHARARETAGYCAALNGNYDRAAAHFEHLVVLQYQREDPVGIAAALRGRGWVAMFAQEFDRAHDFTTQALSLSSEVADPIGMAWGRHDLAEQTLVRGEFAEAETQYRAVVRELLDLQILFGAYRALLRLGFLARVQGDRIAAREHYVHALDLLPGVKVRHLGRADGLEGMAGTARPRIDNAYAAVMCSPTRRMPTARPRRPSGCASKSRATKPIWRWRAVGPIRVALGRRLGHGSGHVH
ncbi:MAG: hypothetical protein H6644_18820 [Caldilineaceae bacterium]|nr:hypothetical protein [Caldilineaceae bacterium]